jgi:hypothetical protein
MYLILCLLLMMEWNGIVGLEESTTNIVFVFEFEFEFVFEANIISLETHCSYIQCMVSFWLKHEQKDACEYIQTNQKDYPMVFKNLSLKLKNLVLTYKLI